jgi:glyceraldehyde 3-phosphate dehydrogenase
MTQVVDGDLVKILSWYDNEWGYVSQMIRNAMRMVEHGSRKKTIVGDGGRKD